MKHDIPAVGTKVMFNDGDEFRIVVAVGEFITFDDKSWIDFRTWRSGIRDRIIVVQEAGR